MTLQTPAGLRAACRRGRAAPTSGHTIGSTQCNLIARQKDWAWDFLLFAQRNPRPCPVLDMTKPGRLDTVLAAGADLRRALPLYRVWRDGVMVEDVPDASAAGAEHPDLVAFLIGCSFPFETPLLQAGIQIRHIAQGYSMPLYRTNRPGEVPVFRACGVTPQAAVMASKVPFAITHAPGHMVVTDIPDRAWQT